MSSNYYGAKLWYTIIRGHIKYLPSNVLSAASQSQTWINSISPELCPPLTCERACSGNENALAIESKLWSQRGLVASLSNLSVRNIFVTIRVCLGGCTVSCSCTCTKCRIFAHTGMTLPVYFAHEVLVTSKPLDSVSQWSECCTAITANT